MLFNSSELDLLSSFKIGLIGYGAQGSAEAQNLKRSGVKFTLGLRPEGKSDAKAKQAGFEPLGFKEVVAQSQVILLNLPDQLHSDFYREYLVNSPVEHIVFAHGFSSYFQKVPVEKISHLLIAPKGAASGLVNLYGTPQALAAILASKHPGGRPITPHEKNWMELLARAMGCNPRALIWADFKDETVCDLFSEQALLCGGLSSLLRRSYEVLVEAGYHPEAAYFETVYELKLIVDLIWKEGITGMRSRISPTARFGDITRGDRIIDDSVKRRMKEVLQEIENGKFAAEFLNSTNSCDAADIEEAQAVHPIEKIGKKLRAEIFQ